MKEKEPKAFQRSCCSTTAAAGSSADATPRMGGHGGLNILPQKSWNVWNRSNRERVARDEAQAAQQAADEELKAAAEQASLNLLTLRARASGSTEAPEMPAPDAPSAHINFFAEIEAAERIAKREQEAKRKERLEVSKLMPDLDLSKSAREPAPWYTQPPTPTVAPPAPSLAPLPILTTMAVKEDDDERRSRKRKHRHKHDKQQDKHDKKHDKHNKKHKRHQSERGQRSSSDEVDQKETVLQQLRRERLERERHEQQRSIGSSNQPRDDGLARASFGSSGGASRWGGAFDNGGTNGMREHAEQMQGARALHDKFKKLVGDTVELPPRPPRARRR